MIKFESTQTPFLVFIESERSCSIGKFIVKREDGTVKEYVLRTTKEGKLILN